MAQVDRSFVTGDTGLAAFGVDSARIAPTEELFEDIFQVHLSV